MDVKTGIRVKGYALAGVSAVTYGMIPLFALPLKKVDFSFDAVLFYRFLFTAIIAGGYLAIKKIDLRINIKEFGALILLGLMYTGSSHFLFVGYDHMPAGVASTILFMYPVFVALIMGIFFNEKLSWVMWVAIALALLGVGVLGSGEGGFSITPIGLGIVLLSALSYALYMVAVNKSAVRDMNGMKVTFYSMTICTLFFLISALAKGEFQPIPSVEVGVNLVLFGVVTTALSLIAMILAIKLIGSTPTAVMGSLEPVVAVAISVVIFGESFTSSLLIGIVLIVGAVTLTVLSGYVIKATKKIPGVVGLNRRRKR